MEDALATLRYDPKWIDYGFLDEPLLRRQIEEYETSDDKNTEHYRYRAFCALLGRCDGFDEATIERYVELAVSDADESMARSALIQLIQWSCLTDDQLDALRDHPAFEVQMLQRMITRTQLLRQLARTELTDELFQLYLSANDPVIVHALVSRDSLTVDQLEAILKSGPTRTIRLMIEEQLRSRVGQA